jgi:hypothetical protein
VPQCWARHVTDSAFQVTLHELGEHNRSLKQVRRRTCPLETCYERTAWALRSLQSFLQSLESSERSEISPVSVDDYETDNSSLL